MVNLKQARDAAGLTQAQLSEQSGVSVRTIKRLESDAETSAGTVVTLAALADALGVTVDALLTDAPDPQVAA